MIKGYEIEDKVAPRAVEILETHGFRHIVRMPRLCLYDFEGEKGKERFYIEMRFRSKEKAPYFVFKESKVNRLRELKKSTKCEVLVLFIWGKSHKLVKIEEISKELTPIKVFLYGKKVPGLRFPVKGEVTAEEEAEIKKLRLEGLTMREIAGRLNRAEITISRHLPLELRKLRKKRVHKLRMLRIRCSSETFKKFKRATINFSTYEDTLNHLLKHNIVIEDERLLEWLDMRIEEGRFRSYSHAVEEGLRLLKTREPVPFSKA